MTAVKRPIRVLLVDDDETFRRVMSAELSRRGFTLSLAASGKEALERIAEADPRVVLLDLRLPDMDGIEVLKKVRESHAAVGVVVLTGHGTIDTALQATRLGAYDYLEKPCPLDAVDLTIRKTYEHLGLVERQSVLEDGYASPDVGPDFVGKSVAFARILEAIDRYAPTDSTTLILGETGVGKERVARLLHVRSRRKERPFVVVDCAALHENLLQSELFGHEKGAFTGAARQKHGLFEVAHTGTIFLDEIGDMSLETQARLLRVIETGRFRRVGGTQEISVDVRVLSATNRNLREASARGHFREDLFFRLSPLTIEIPPLRERPDDVRVLVEHFTRQFNARFLRSKAFGPEAMEMLAHYRWPGNIRELIHVIEQVMVLSDRDAIGPEHLPALVRASIPAPGAAATSGDPLPLRELQRRHVLSVMERVHGNRAQAARILEISERNLYRLLKKYGHEDPPAPV